MKIIRILLLTLMMIFTATLSAENKQFSVQWQRIELENQIKQKISDFLSLIVDKKRFFVEVQIAATNPNLSLPKFKMPKNKSMADIKFSDDKKKSKNNGEFLLFDKVGIMAPLFKGTSKNNDQELQVKFFQYKEKLQRELISKTDLFGLITDVKINIAFDSEMTEEQVTEFKKLIEKIVPSFGEVKPKLEVFKMKFVRGDQTIDHPLFKHIPHVTGPVGAILATLLFCLTAFIIVAGYKKHQKQLAEQNASMTQTITQAEAEKVEEDSLPSTQDTVDPNFRPGSPQLIEAIKVQEEGVKRLFLYLEKSYAEACNLIKKWINLDSSLANATLVVLSERMSIDELYKVFAKLTDEEREQWIKISSNSDISPDLKNQADAFIAQQVLEDIMTVSATDDEELLKLLVELTPAKAAGISRKNVEHGALLVNMMASNFLSQMYYHLTSEEISDISLKGLQLENEEIKAKCEDLKQVLEQVVDSKYSNPFSRRIVEVITELDPLKQENMIDVLLSEKQEFIVRDIARSIVPVKVLELLPADILKAIGKGLDKELRLNYLVSTSETNRKKFIESTTQEGTKGREVLEFELQKIEEDEVRVKHLKNKKDEIYIKYILSAREIIKSNPKLKIAVSDIVGGWIDAACGTSDNVVAIKEVSEPNNEAA